MTQTSCTVNCAKCISQASVYIPTQPGALQLLSHLAGAGSVGLLSRFHKQTGHTLDCHTKPGPENGTIIRRLTHSPPCCEKNTLNSPGLVMETTVLVVPTPVQGSCPTSCTLRLQADDFSALGFVFSSTKEDQRAINNVAALAMPRQRA